MISCDRPGWSTTDRSAQPTSALVSAASPGAVTPSSLVTRILTCAHPTGRPAPRQGRSPDGRGPFTGASRAARSPPHPCGGPGLLQFTRDDGPNTQDLRGLAHRPAVAHRARASGGHRLRGRRDPPGVLGGGARGDRRLRRRRVVPLGSGTGAGPLAQPPGGRPLRVQRGPRPGRPGRAGAPQRHPRAGPLAALDAPDPAPEPALASAAAPSVAGLPVLAAARDRLPRGPGRPRR